MNAKSIPHQNATAPPRAAAASRGPQGVAFSTCARAPATPPTAPVTKPTTRGRAKACHNTGWRRSIPNCGKPSVMGKAATNIGSANPGPTAEPASAEAAGRRSSPRPCSLPARYASTSTAIVSAPIATCKVATEVAPSAPSVDVKGTRTLARVSASPILNHDHGWYQPLAAYVSHASAWPATKIGRNTRNAPRRSPPTSRALGRVSGATCAATAPAALIRTGAPPRSSRPATASARR